MFWSGKRASENTGMVPSVPRNIFYLGKCASPRQSAVSIVRASLPKPAKFFFTPKCPVSTSSSGPATGQQGEELIPPAPRPRKRCDPYGLKGRPLSSKRVADLIKTLNARWHYNQDSKTLVSTSCVPSPNVSFALLKRVETVSTNTGHWPFSVYVKGSEPLPSDKPPERIASEPPPPEGEVIAIPASEITFELKTAALDGLSYNDFALAMQLDAAIAQCGGVARRF